MSPVVLLLAVIAGSISASTIREYTGGNDVSDIFDHQDNVLDEIEEMPTLPAEFDSEWDNTTNGDMPDMKCMAYFMCMMQNESPEPSGSFKNGFDVTPKFLKKHCRYMKKSLACYYDGEYADCPDVVNFVESLTARYQYMCFQPGKSVVQSMLPCFNKYDVQMSLLTVIQWNDIFDGNYHELAKPEAFGYRLHDVLGNGEILLRDWSRGRTPLFG
ncbi:uncharacterized protein LOC117337885 isoform X2 [Pecten maximus]|uniref:uncharacterized protein LOC117337885 isoform X2 n=1 Tax=Pecten maximus TaxID=6579 RepID=UPI0014586A78|nr:uncharacterized protein LOC117337885 isoform X2 [Pecten maximus]